MTRDRRTSERGALGRFIDRLLGRDRGDRRKGAPGASEGTPLFTAHQPPPSGRPPEEEAPRADAASGATTVPVPETPPTEPDLFDDHPLRRAPLDAWEAEPPPAPRREPEPRPKAPEPAPEPEARPEAEPEPEPAAAVEPEPGPEPEPEPEQEPEPPEDGLHTAVHEEALERVAPRARNAPGVRVHDDNLDQRSGPVRLTPSQAIELARGGRESLRRRDRD